MKVLSIDPGTDRSAWLVLRDGVPLRFGIKANAELVWDVASCGERGSVDLIVIEQIESFGMPVGREVFETVRWAGRFEQAAHPLSVVWIPRRAVKLALCQSPKANDASIRQALIDRFGGSSAIGRKADPGPLYGITKDVWSALALAVTQLEADAA